MFVKAIADTKNGRDGYDCSLVGSRRVDGKSLHILMHPGKIARAKREETTTITSQKKEIRSSSASELWHCPRNLRAAGWQLGFRYA